MKNFTPVTIEQSNEVVSISTSYFGDLGFQISTQKLGSTNLVIRIPDTHAIKTSSTYFPLYYSSSYLQQSWNDRVADYISVNY